MPAGRHARPLLRRAWAALVVLVVSFAARPAGAQPATAAAPPAPDALVVPGGTTRDGSVVLLAGDLDVRGLVRGDAVSVFGDVRVGPGGRVTGTARSLFGRARVDGGQVDGRVRSGWRDADVGVRPTASTPWAALRLTLAWFAVLLVLGVGLLSGASTQLDAVVGVLEATPGRSVALGVAGQLALAPALVVIVAALAVTVVGVLAVPLAVVAFVLAAAGLLTLGFLASAFVLGRWTSGARRTGSGRPRATAARGDALRALGVGLAFFLAVWAAAAALGGVAIGGLLTRTVAVALTWVAVTAGFGAALLSRGGTRGARGGRATASAGAGDARGGVPVWQTPTPIAGVVAARRPGGPAAARPTAGAGTRAE